MVLRLPLWLVERGYFSKVEFVFLIVGHTKNPCDSAFNHLKSTYRRSNIYTMEQTLEKLNEHWKTTAVEFTDHRNWDSYLDQLYRRFDGNTIKKYHNFEVNIESGPTFMKINVSRLATDEGGQKTKEFARLVQNRDMLLRQKPELLRKPGIKLIKQIELGTKWRQHVPEEYRDIICPIPTEAMVQQHKQSRKEKKKAVEESAHNNGEALEAYEPPKKTAEDTQGNEDIPTEQALL
jgi:hypothetical protein